MTQEQDAPKTLDDLENNPQNNWEWDAELQKVEKRYQLISSLIFKYWILALTIITTITIFFIELQKRKTLSFDNEYEAKKIFLIWQFNKEQEQIQKYEQNPNLKIIVKQWSLTVSEDIIHSYNNLITYKGFTMPRWTFLYEPNEIQNIEYFNDQNYDIAELEKIINNTIFTDYNEIWSKETNDITLLPLENNSIEDTFFISCANQHKLFNWVCNNYINKFLNWFFVYDIDNDFPWMNKTLKNIMWRKKYKENACIWLNNFIKYSQSTPAEIEWLFSICWKDYSETFDLIQTFIDTKKDLENRYINPNLSKYREINEYKLISYQQIIYNNLKNSIPPYEWMYKNYTNYLTNILKKTDWNIINQFYYDLTYRFNNIYLIPTLNKIKYESIQSKRDEIESIITDIERINKWNNIDWYVWLKSKIINSALEESVKEIWWNIIHNKDSSIENLLKSLKSLSYLKIINEEIIENIIKINWYISIKIDWDNVAIPFGWTFEQKNWLLIVKNFSLNTEEKQLRINEILEVIIAQKEYTIWEIYEFIQKNFKIYESNSTSITPCILIKDRLEKLKLEWLDIINCSESSINIIKWQSWNKTLYQFNLDNFNIKEIKSTNQEIQKYINNNYIWKKTNATTISNIVEEIITYVPKTWDNKLTWNNNTLIAITDLNKFLWVEIINIWEKNWRTAFEFIIKDIDLIWVYNINSKVLWPLYLTWVSSWTWTEKNPKINNFSLILSQDNQNEINKFLIDPFWYLYKIDEATITKYLPEKLEEYKWKKN